jgi:hypothetical protein
MLYSYYSEALNPLLVDTPRIDQQFSNPHHYFAAMTLKEFSFLLKDAVIDGTNKALIESGQIPDTLTKAQAFRLFGRSNVERWISEGLVNPIKQRGNSSKKFIDRLKLESVARSSNRTTYLPVSER